MQGRDPKKARIYFIIAVVLLLLAFVLYLLTRDADPDEIVVEGNAMQIICAQLSQETIHTTLSECDVFTI